MKKWNKLPLLFIGTSLVLLLGIGTLAYWKQVGSTGNILTVSAFQNRIVEKYQVPQPVNPGEEIDKVVSVKNTGNVDSLIRVAVKKVFGKVKSDGSFQEDPSLDGEMIEITYDDDYWIQKEDGYFYYKEVLKAGQTTGEPLFRSYRLSEHAENAYRGMDARIIVTMEAMQADTDPESIWNISAKELGIRIKKGTSGADTKVVYQGKNGGFRISESTTDLFASFKNLTPGCGRVQNIQIENQSEEKVEILLRAEEMQQLASSSKQRELIRTLLEEDAVIQIKEEDKLLYQGPVSGSGGSKNAMKEDISLGMFSGNSSKKLTVTLKMNPQTTVEAASLTAKVRWVFTAKGEDQTTTTSRSVYGGGFLKTMDTSGVFGWLAVLLLAALVLTGLFRKRRKQKRV